MARPRAPDHDQQLAAILACAAGLFAARGYHGTSMNEVAQAAGIGKATLYHYVRDKPALVVQIAQRHVATLLALVAEVRALQLAPQAHLRTLLTRFMTVYAGAQAAHRVLTEDVKFLPPMRPTRCAPANVRSWPSSRAASRSCGPTCVRRRHRWRCCCWA
jgi:AcrR family transcriptional regulator